MAIDTQRGQALVEAVMVLAILLLLGAGIAVLGRLQWQGLEMTRVGRTYAFRYAQGERATPPPGVWHGRANHAPAFLGPGGAQTILLRRDWGVEDKGIVTAYAKAVPAVVNGVGQPYIVQRHISLLAEAGHAVSDEHTQQRIGSSNTAWRQAIQLSHHAGQRVAAALDGIDRAWGRAAPQFDWLMPWSDLVAHERLQQRPITTREQP
jgi:hypothetical protein